MTRSDLTVSHGYPLEEHFVETVDGYILRLFRIPHGREQPDSAAGLTPCHHQQNHQVTTAAAGRGRQRSQQAGLLWLSWSRLVKSALALSGKPQDNNISPLQSDCKTAAKAAAHRPVVHFQHGLLGSSTDFVLNGPGLSLPLLLADAGGGAGGIISMYLISVRPSVHGCRMISLACALWYASTACSQPIKLMINLLVVLP